MHGKFGLLSTGKASSHSTALPNFLLFFLFPCVQCSCVYIQPAVMPTLLRQIDIGSLMCAHMWGCAVHTKGGSGTNKSAQELTWRNRKAVPHPAPPRHRPQGLWIYIPVLYNHWDIFPVQTDMSDPTDSDTETSKMYIYGSFSKTVYH